MKITLLRDIGKRLLKEIKGSAALTNKESATLTTGASGDKTFPIDRKAEEIIIEGLKRAGKPLTIISEEAGVIEFKGGGRIALIDPIDGSKNAVSGIPFYCASIAIADGPKIKDISLSYVINLINGDEFWAEKGKGAFLNGKPVAAQKTEEFSLIAYEAQVPGKDIPKILPLLSKAHKTRCLGATALDLAYLSSGGISVFLTPALSRSFDFGGGWLLVGESGGVFTDINGGSVEDIELGLKRASSILASGNKKLHEKALRMLHSG